MADGIKTSSWPWPTARQPRHAIDGINDRLNTEQYTRLVKTGLVVAVRTVSQTLVKNKNDPRVGHGTAETTED